MKEAKEFIKKKGYDPDCYKMEAKWLKEFADQQVRKELEKVVKSENEEIFKLVIDRLDSFVEHTRKRKQEYSEWSKATKKGVKAYEKSILTLIDFKLVMFSFFKHRFRNINHYNHNYSKLSQNKED